MRPRLTAGYFLFFALFFIAPNAIAADSCIDINTASLEELDKIKYIGESRAKQIITLRGEKLFSSVDDLDRVVGIGPAIVANIKQEGLACVQAQTPLAEPIIKAEPPITATLTAEVQLQKIYPSGIIINEIMPSPEGADETEEWIKVFNKNNFEVDLSSWQISDKVGKINTYTIPVGTKIPATGFLTLSRPETKIILNNDNDGLDLTQPDGKIADSISYEKAILGQSYGPGAADIIPTASASAKDTADKLADKVGLAAISEPIIEGQNKRNFYPILAASALAILSGFVILLLKHVRA
ncbi:MAG: lamin tail domain-containing protein [bacterium]|nr:lamin tail domain-containing protein [bacterium]